MLQLEEALDRILAAVPSPQPEKVSLEAAANRFLFAGVFSPCDLPPFANSSVDGYAIVATDTTHASVRNPTLLRLAGKVAAGEPAELSLGQGHCIRVFTGSPLPPGADAVVMQEDVHVEGGGGPECIRLVSPLSAGENVRRKGEDVARGSVLMRKGERLRAGGLALLAGTGFGEVAVSRLPRVGLIATGSELIEPGNSLKPGQIYESNRAALATLVRNGLGIPRTFPIVRDTMEDVRAVLRVALEECDVLVTCGGVSVGEFDFVKQAFEGLGGKLDFWRIAIKPGKPFVFGFLEGKLFCGLPGNPVSALVTFLLLVRPALLRWQGAADVNPDLRDGILGEPFENTGDRRHFVRVKVTENGRVFSAGKQGSHMLGSLAQAIGLVDLAPGVRLPAGAPVKVILF
jgi:molybdopterin molybdotransferase